MSDVADEEVKQYCDAESLINERSGQWRLTRRRPPKLCRGRVSRSASESASWGAGLVTDNTAPLLGYKPNTACRWLIKPVRGPPSWVD